jgi:hypothetical protein
MFGLTRREQRWKAEQEAATLLVALATSAIEARAKIDVAEANAKAVADALELERLRAENLRLQSELDKHTHNVELLHEDINWEREHRRSKDFGVVDTEVKTC